MSKDVEGGAPEVIVEVGGNDPDRGCAAKQPNNGFVKMIRVGMRIRQAIFDAIMNRDAVLCQTTQVTIDKLMVTDRVCYATKFRSQVEEVWVIRRRVDRHSCAGEQDEFTPFLCVNYRLRQITS